jgi:two-component system, NtrC family, sensor histidine kinase HydH
LPPGAKPHMNNLLSPKSHTDRWWKIVTLALTVALTVAIHYGWIIEPIFGHSNWGHAIHSRLCYIPIVVAAAWFGLRGALLTALAISVLVQPYIFLLNNPHVDVSGELVEIIFYFAIALLTGALIDRESRIRRRQEETQLQLERSHKLSIIGQMAAGVAHEIKNPLASIKGAVEIVAGDTATAEEKQEFHGIINKEIKRIDSTVKEFLEFARPRETALHRINLGETVHGSLKQLQSQINQAGLEIKAEIADNIYILADSEQIHQVLLNLILNALEASAPGGRIELVLTMQDADAHLTVRDFGGGISEPDRERIFEPFYTTKTKGTGLGLAITKSIIDRHRGRIEVESRLNEGTAFHITLPLDRESR